MSLFYFVLPVHILASLFLIFVVLLQSGKSGDIASAFGGSGSQTAFGPRGSGNVLTKATAFAAALFMVTSLSLVMLGQGGSNVLDELEDLPTIPAATESATESAPETLPENETAAPSETSAEEGLGEVAPESN